MNIKDMKCSIGALVKSGKLAAMPDTSPEQFERIANLSFRYGDLCAVADVPKYIGVTEEFCKIISLFHVAPKNIPAGFRPCLLLGEDNSIRVNLVRDISYEANGKKRPTNVLYSANSANPFEVEAMKDLIANLTTNPQIIYEHFIKNPKANIGGEFKDRFEVLEELCRIVGPGVDISVEFNNPFAPESELMEEIAHCEEILTPYRLVVKVPHTGPLNKNNVETFLNGRLDKNYDEGTVQDNFYGHNLAYKLTQKGYRINFTLMLEPYQTQLALLAKPYFINAFVETRYLDTLQLKDTLQKYEQTKDLHYAEQLKEIMIKNDTLAGAKTGITSADAVEKARELIKYRAIDTPEGVDGLDSVRHSLRVMRQSNLPHTRLIICNTKRAKTYWDIDKMLMEPEFSDMTHRVVITCAPSYFGLFTSAPGVISYQRKFLKSVES